MNKKVSLLFVALLLSVLVLTAIGCSQHQPTPTDQVVTLTVNYDRSVDDGVLAGHYDYASPNITDRNFNITDRPTAQHGTKEVVVHLIHFNRLISTDEALRKLDKQNLHPANLQELLALGEKRPDLQREFPIIALGSVWLNLSGYCDCPSLDGYSSKRHLRLNWVNYYWNDLCRFAAVSKPA